MSILETSPLAPYAQYEDPDTHTILFRRVSSHYNRTKTYHYYLYNTRTQAMVRVYAKDKKTRMGSWWARTGEEAVIRYIGWYLLIPIWPKHMVVDIGL